MSRENLEIVQRVGELMAECYRTGRATDAVLELLAPDFRMDASHRVFNPDMYEGEAGLNRMIRETNEAWEDFREKNERLIDLGDRVLVIQTISGRGRTSRADVELTGALIFTLEGGRATSVEVYPDHEEALKAVGLAE